MVGEINGLKNPIAAFLKLKDSSVLGNMTEVPLPTRFVFILLAPPVS
jgi:sodium bicarbonate transporter 10